MNIDKKTGIIAFVSLAVALIWSWPSIRMYGSVEANLSGVLAGVLVRTVIIFAVIRFVFWIFGKKK